jgi:hypothetical protein
VVASSGREDLLARTLTIVTPPPCTVVIGAPDLLPALKKRAADGAGEVLAFTDADALLALEAITERRPQIVALERVFAATPRGAALINRIKADPSLTQSEIRVVAHDSEYSRVSPRKPEPGGPVAAAPAAAAAASAPVAAPVAPVLAPLDQRGTRRAPRFRIAGSVEVLVDGNTATLVDLSTIGAHVVSPTILKPNQRVRMALADDKATVRFNAAVAWASFEIPPKAAPRYRAGIEFMDADSAAVDAFCERHKA